VSERPDREGPAKAPLRGAVRLLLATALGLGLLAYAWWADPAKSAGYLPCTFHWLTGLYCPGCGGQRALHALLHGRIAEALRCNLLAVGLFAPLGLAGYALYARECLAPSARRPPRSVARWVVLFLLLALIYGVARNLPGPAFDLLRP